MAIRTINYSVSSDGISPKTEQRAGLQSEHAVTQLVFTLDNTLYQALLDEKQDGDTLVYRFDCIDSTGGTVRTDTAELTDSVITFTVGENLTRNGGKARVYLVVSRYNAEEETEIEMLSFPARLRFENVPASDNGNSRESLSTLTEAAKNAAKRSKESAESAKQSADTAEKLIDKVKDDITELQNGGYVADAQKISEKINDWLNAHPEATTTVQDGSILLKHLNNELKEYISASVNVKDFGAVGDGITNDEQAIKNAFDYAINNLPCEVYFPKGEYGILNGGITVKMPLGSGGLTVRGDGYNLSKIKYLKDWATNGTWYAIRIQPISTPESESEYLHDIAYMDIGVYDTDPINHAHNPDKGDEDKEETHGFDLQYCIRGMVKNCKIENVGDEAIDIYSCIDTIVTNNFIIGSPGAGEAGGAISIGDGSKNVIVSNNNVSGSITTKGNFGIAIESLYIPVNDVVVEGNIISNITGNGINIACTNNGAMAENILISDNVITNCTTGIASNGVYPKYIKISNNEICDNITFGMELLNLCDSCIDNCNIKNSEIAIHITVLDSSVVINITNCIISNIQNRAIFTSTNTYISDCYIDGVGLDGSNPAGAITQFTAGSTLEIKDTKLRNIQCNKGVHQATKLINVDVEFADGETGQAFSGNYVELISGGYIKNGYVNIYKNNAIVRDLRIEATVNLWTAALGLANVTGVSVIGCVIITDNTSYLAIKESGASDYNLIANNVTKKGIDALGANTVAVNNISLSKVSG